VPVAYRMRPLALLIHLDYGVNGQFKYPQMLSPLRVISFDVSRSWSRGLSFSEAGRMARIADAEPS
jgi:hypothetical protein